MKFSIFLAMLFLLTTQSVSAAWNVDRDDLDDDIVEDLYIPVLFGVLADDIVPDFGDPRGGGSRSHEGQDMFAVEGTPIVSPTQAIVIRTGEGSSAGKYVYTANPGGETFRYMHLETVADLDTGDKLNAGDFLGTVGDTGNAPDGVYHLHFEIRDEDNDPIDPYDRLTKDFTIKKQVSFLKDIFREIRNDEEYAEFLIESYPEVFEEALEENYSLPRELDEALEDSEIEEKRDAEESLLDLLKTLPLALQSEMSEGDSGVLVALLQIYLIYTTDGDARDALAAAGPTGYFGAITRAALVEYQDAKNITETGVYDSKTRWKMLDERTVLNLE